MPQRTEVAERYWCPGYWPWQWADTCTRIVTKWCYDFQWIKENDWFFFSYLEGCENGTKYCCYAFGFGLFGSGTYYNIRLCFGSQKSNCGKCGR